MKTTLKEELDYIQTLIHLINYGVNGSPGGDVRSEIVERLNEYVKKAVTEIDQILKNWGDYPDLVQDYPYPDEEDSEEDSV